jgi:hypothetical protein
MTNPPLVGSAVSAVQAGGSTLFLPSIIAQNGGVILVWAGGNTVLAVADGSGNEYVFQKQVTVNGTVFVLYVAQDVTPGLTGVYVIFASGSGETAAAAVPLSQVPAASLDAVGMGTTGSSALAQDTVTTSIDHDQVLLGVLARGSPISVSPGSGTIITQATGYSLTIAIGSVTVVPAGLTTTQAALSSSSFWGGINGAVLGLASIPPLSALGVGAPTFGNSPLLVQFQGVASGGVSPYTYAWAFGDGGSSGLQNPQHLYANGGMYTATLIVTDSASNTASSTVTITVNSPPSPTGGSSSSGGSSPVTQPCVVFVAAGGTPIPPPVQPFIAPASLENIPSAYYDRCESVWVSPTGTIIGPNFTN